MTTNVPPSNSAMPTTRGLNFFDADPNLAFSLKRHAGEGEAARATPLLQEMGAIAGGELDMLAMLADHNPPTLRSFDERGQRIDEVVYHPAFIEMQRIGFSQFGFASMSHRDGVLGWPGRVPHVVKYALSYLFVQSEFGLFCPISMTDSAARVVTRFGPDELRKRYVPGLTSSDSGRCCNRHSSSPSAREGVMSGRTNVWRGRRTRAAGRSRARSGSVRTRARTCCSHWRGRRGR